MKKRGQSGVLTTVLTILIILVSIVVVWNVVIAILNTNSSKVSANVFTNTFQIKSAVINPNGLYSIRVTRDTGSDTVDSLKITIQYDDNSQEVYEEKGSNLPKQFETKEFNYTGKRPITQITITPIIGNNPGIASNQQIIPFTGTIVSLFNNPSFESGTTSWGAYGWGGAGETINLNSVPDTTAPNGNNVMKIDCVNIGASRPCGIYQGPYTFDANTNYTIEYKIKCPAGRTIHLTPTNIVGWWPISNPTCTGNWQTYVKKYYYTSVQSDSVFLGDFGGGTFTYYVDSAMFRKGN